MSVKEKRRVGFRVACDFVSDASLKKIEKNFAITSRRAAIACRFAQDAAISREALIVKVID
jgi:hypothetical protein